MSEFEIRSILLMFFHPLPIFLSYSLSPHSLFNFRLSSHLVFSPATQKMTRGKRRWKSEKQQMTHRMYWECTSNVLRVLSFHRCSLSAISPFPSSLIHRVFLVYVWLVSSHEMRVKSEIDRKVDGKETRRKDVWDDVEYNVRRERRGNEPSSI